MWNGPEPGRKPSTTAIPLIKAIEQALAAEGPDDRVEHDISSHFQAPRALRVDMSRDRYARETYGRVGCPQERHWTRREVQLGEQGIRLIRNSTRTAYPV